MVKYEYKHGLILKDGHTMFLEDVIKDLNNYAQKNEETPETIDNTSSPKLPSLEECIWQAVDANKGAHAYDHDTSTVKKVYKFIAGKIGR